jgi:hypothetical protein
MNEKPSGRRKKGRTSFLKKRSKKLFYAVASLRREIKVFWFFFSKKNVPSALAFA